MATRCTVKALPTTTATAKPKTRSAARSSPKRTARAATTTTATATASKPKAPASTSGRSKGKGAAPPAAPPLAFIDAPDALPTPELTAAICGYVREGTPRKHAARAAGVEVRTFRRWLRDGQADDAPAELRALVAGVEKARGDAVVYAIRLARMAAEAGKWDAVAWWAERVEWEDFARRAPDVAVQVNNTVFNEATDAVLRAVHEATTETGRELAAELDAALNGLASPAVMAVRDKLRRLDALVTATTASRAAARRDDDEGLDRGRPATAAMH